MHLNKMKISVIGGGSMGCAIINGLLSDNSIDPSSLSISNPHIEKISAYKDKGVRIYSDNKEAIKNADLLILCVKPWIIPEVIEELKYCLDTEKTTVCSIAAGISSHDLAGMFGEYLPADLCTAIPNTAMAVKESMTFIVPVNGSPLKVVELFKALGEVMVTDEKHLPAGMALASCGIAFAMRYVRAACEGGVELGFKASQAQEIVCQTLKGTVSLLQHPGVHPEPEIDKVTTPGGFTIKGLNAMERFGFTTSVIEGLKACVAFPHSTTGTSI